MNNHFATNELLLEASDLSHRFQKQSKAIIEKTNITLKLGQRLALIGRSGSGKTTLLHFLSGLRRPQSGQVRFQGIDFATCDADTLAHIRNQKIGFVYQNACLLRDFNVIDNVALVAQVGSYSREDAQKKAYSVLKSIQIEHLAKRPPHELSGGEKQRVAIARAIINDPLVLFADEPTGNLDQESAGQIMKTLNTLQQKNQMSIVMATHDMGIAKTFERQLVLEKNIQV
jgi:lipoprotein-releasing system ATP-binding protein